MLDSALAKELLASREDNEVNTILGTTMCTDDFYEGVWMCMIGVSTQLKSLSQDSH